MPERPQDDPTHDIALPPLPDRPPSALPRQWASHQPSPSPKPEAPAVLQAAPRTRRRSLTDLPTDELDPPSGRPRERTIAFAAPEMAPGRPAPTVGPTARRPRRWPWVVLALVPVLVIAGAGVLLAMLLHGG
jgi:hypothetical protein